MLNNFCEKTFSAYIETLSSQTETQLYLFNALILKVKDGDVSIRFEKGNWSVLTINDICFLPKGKTIEMKKNSASSLCKIDVLPISTEMLNNFYHQYSSLFINHKTTKDISKICITDLGNMPITGDVFNSAIKEMSNINKQAQYNIKSTDYHKVNIHLNFVLSFFLLTHEFLPALLLSINEKIKDKVYNLIFHSTGQQSCTLEIIAKKLHMSSSTLKRRLVQEKTSFSEISLMSRMNKAMLLSKTNNMPMSRIAQEVGYEDIPYFLSTFKKFFNSQATPSLIATV